EHCFKGIQCGRVQPVSRESGDLHKARGGGKTQRQGLRRSYSQGVLRVADPSSQDHSSREGGRSRGQNDRESAPVHGRGRHYRGRRQRVVRGVDPSHQVPGGERLQLRIHGRVGRRDRRAPRPVADAERTEGGVRRAGGHPDEDCSAGGRRGVRDVHRRCGVWQLREDGAQRHRVRGHGADHRGVPHAEERGLLERGDERHLPRVERGRAGLVPGGDHESDPGEARRGRGGSAAAGGLPGGQDFGRGRLEGHGHDDGEGGGGARRGGAHHRRGAIRAVPVGREGPAHARGVADARAGVRLERRGQKAAGGGPARRAVLLEAGGVRAGAAADPDGVAAVQVGHRPGRVRAHLEGRLHHPREDPGPHQAGLCQGRPAAPAARPRLRAGAGDAADGVAARGGSGGGQRRVHSGAHLQSGVLRLLPVAAPAHEPAAGAARLLRLAHLRARGPAARKGLPLQVDQRACVVVS
ncbi:6-phosphogluconate dehydrogenase, partial [Blastocystis sp. ATCC 50177/Nand II]